MKRPTSPPPAPAEPGCASREAPGGTGAREPRTTPGRRWAGPAALGLVLSALACTDVLPCTDCPPVEGAWVFGYNEQSRSPGCAQVQTADAPGTLTFTRQGARLQTRTGGVDLVGTVYDTWDLVMSGGGTAADGGNVDLGLRGRYVPGKPDAGTDAQLRGTFTARSTRGDLSCEVVRDFTAVR